jgi:hypothetical protein
VPDGRQLPDERGRHARDAAIRPSVFAVRCDVEDPQGLRL